jgi:hypothetical protein
MCFSHQPDPPPIYPKQVLQPTDGPFGVDDSLRAHQVKELMYDHSSIFIVSILFIVLVVAIELAYRAGTRLQSTANDSAKNQINTIQGSLLGVLALLLAFTFSLALQRYDSRSQAVIIEANAIGTAILRTELLPTTVSEQAGRLLGDYLDLRIRASAISLDRDEERNAILAASNDKLNALWAVAVEAAAQEANPVTSGLFIQSLNEVIDAYGTRDAELNRHVPEIVLFMLFGAFILAACLIGYASGIGGHRASFATYILVVMISLLVFLIIDLDRPRRGLIEVPQKSLIDLQASINSSREIASNTVSN